ncbi:alpha/beta fold hydrolase [Pseudonocardia humida]|uniref:Alpha/beta hydrolase n=1 Tax=Pseudonocardia humida TaxID=2800819 RepID=A0ABT0ZYH5_9PSEU|nr:alpha/beta hydrolase [Pseudonocardia humida]MCO1655766.1 alpha/beta hydrolase [Pseudonocardia humida]
MIQGDPMELDHRVTGEGRPLLLVHGAAEDVDMLAPQAEAFAARGRRVLWYSRRGTGASTRTGWPDGGVAAHVDDAAALLRGLGAAPATVLGFSSGGVIALALAARHPDVVTEAIAWEPAALGVLPDADALHAQVVAPIDAHLQAHPDDWAGAYAVMLDVLSEGRADMASEAVRLQTVNAEAALRDDARIITRHRFAAGELPADRVVIAVGGGTSPLHAMIAERLAELVGRAPLVVEDAKDHEVYLQQPDVLADALAPR